MTSSLVGSEMCIRDRLQSTGIMATPMRIWSRCRARLAKPWQQEHTLQAVSYTHLTLPTICSV
eukprot:10242081-Prorocentrum_lima.AAC.1